MKKLMAALAAALMVSLAVLTGDWIRAHYITTVLWKLSFTSWAKSASSVAISSSTRTLCIR